MKAETESAHPASAVKRRINFDRISQAEERVEAS